MEPGARLCLALCLAGVLPAPGEQQRGARGAESPPVRLRSLEQHPPHAGNPGEGGSGWWGGGTGVPPCSPVPPSCRRVPRSWDPSGGLRLRPGPSKPPLRVSPGCRGAQGRLAYKLLHDLFANYSSALRPVEDTDRALNVTLQVTLAQIIDMVRARARHRHRSAPRSGSCAAAQPLKPARITPKPAPLPSSQLRPLCR